MCIKHFCSEVPAVAQRVKNASGIHEDVDLTQASFCGLRIWHLCSLGYREGSDQRCLAMAQSSSYSSHSTPGPGTSICHRCSTKNKQTKTHFCPKNGLAYFKELLFFFKVSSFYEHYMTVSLFQNYTTFFQTVLFSLIPKFSSINKLCISTLLDQMTDSFVSSFWWLILSGL